MENKKSAFKRKSKNRQFLPIFDQTELFKNYFKHSTNLFLALFNNIFTGKFYAIWRQKVFAVLGGIIMCCGSHDF